MTKAISRLFAVLLLAASAGVAWWGTMAPEPARQAAPPQSRGPARVQSPPEIPRYEAFLSLVDQRLRDPLYDPPPPPEPPPPVVEPPPPIHVDLKLVGTVIEAGRNQALLASPNGSIEIRAEGETVTSHPGNILLQKVTARQAVLRVREPRDEEVTLTIEGGSTN